jgi:xanthine/uracil/vitamin C permease (AzgA family)
MTMSYILLVNGQILGAGGLAVKPVVAATALSSCIASFLAGALANVPFGVSPGMGLNAFLVFSQVLGLGATPQAALAGCMIAAGVVALLASCRALNFILALVPDAIKLATVVGMGLLLSFIGLQTAKVVVPDAETMVTLGDLSGSVEPLLAAAGLALIASLHYRNVRGSIIVGILATALAYYCFLGGWPTEVVALPHLQRVDLDYSTLFGSGGGAGGGAGSGGGGQAAAAATTASVWAAGAAGAAAFRALDAASSPLVLAPRRMLMMIGGGGGGGGGESEQQPALAVAPLPLASAAARAAAERVRLSGGALLLDGDEMQRQQQQQQPSTTTTSSPPSSTPKKKPGTKTTTATKTTAWSAVCAYALVMIFDIGGAMFGLGSLAGLVRQRPDGRGGELPGATWVFLAACLGTALGAATGTTPLIIAAESAVGIKEGGRTGLVAIVISLCFAASCFLAPLLQAIPQVATAPVLVLVGAMMMGESVHIDWGSMPTAVPAFLTIVVQPFTFSIANGIYAGVLMSAALFVLTGGLARAVFGGGAGGAGGVEDSGSSESAEERRCVENEVGVGGGEGGLLGGDAAHDHHHHHHHVPLPFEEPLLTNTYDAHHHHHETNAPTPYKPPTGAPPPGGEQGGAPTTTTTTAPRPIGGGRGDNVTSDGGSDHGGGGVPMAAGRGGGGGGRVGSGGGNTGTAAAAVVGSFSRLASSLTRPSQYERASFTMLTNTGTSAGGGGGGGASGSLSTSQQQRERERQERREQREQQR